MIVLGKVAVLGAGIDAFVTNITDLDIAWIGGQPRLYVVTRPGIGGYAAFGIGAASGAATPISQVSFSPAVGHLGTPELTVIGGANGGMILPAGLSGAAQATYALTANGGFGGVVSFAAGSGPADDLVAIEALSINGQQYLLAARDGAATPVVYSLSGSGSVTLAQTGGSASAGAGIDALTSVVVAGVHYVIAASAAGERITSHALSAAGGLSLADSVDSTSGIGFSAPTGLATATVAGTAFVIAGAGVSSSLTVFRVLPGGALFAVDHVVDSLLTRFQGVTALETLMIGGRAYVFVGGGDDGITVLELLPDGRLIHRTTLADTATTTLADVTAIAAALTGTRAQVFVTSASEAGITQFDFGFGTAGQVIVAPVGAALGGSGDDLLVAGAGTTALAGGAGDDVLVGGGAGGAALLTGGAGSDIFVLSPHAGTIRIADYQVGIDRLDLTSFPLLRGLGQMTAVMTATGAELRYQGTTIRIDSITGSSIPISAFAETDLFGLLRFAPPATVDYLLGSAGDDVLLASDLGATLVGLAGNDDLRGGAVADLIEGGDGNDRLSGAGGNDWLDGGAGVNLLIGGDGADTLLAQDGNDTMFGGSGNDSLSGGGGDDRMFGEDGQDEIDGGAGDDLADGGGGDDRLQGGAGADTVFGGAGRDWLTGGADRDLLFGGEGNDTLDGGEGDDVLFGEGGDDLVRGGDGRDHIDGGAGNDALFGQAGDDTMRAGAGNDTIFGGSGADLLLGGAGADTFVFLDAAEAGIGAAADRIADFVGGEDLIDLSALGLHFIAGAGFSGAAGELRFTADAAGGRLEADIDGDGLGDFALLLGAFTTIDAGDLIL